MRYVNARVRIETEQEAYRIYASDALSGIVKNTSLMTHGLGVEMNKRYYDIIHSKVETRTADEIIGNIKSKLGGGEIV